MMETYWKQDKSGRCFQIEKVAARLSDDEPMLLLREVDHFSIVGPLRVVMAEDFFREAWTPYQRETPE